MPDSLTETLFNATSTCTLHGTRKVSVEDLMQIQTLCEPIRYCGHYCSMPW